jgi:hypothetical protein
VVQFKYLDTTLTYQNSLQEQIKNVLTSGNFLSSSSLSKNLKIKIYRTIILPVALYGFETWSLTLKEDRRLRVSENRVFRRIFGPKRNELTEEWRRLYNEELNDLHSPPIIILVIQSRIIRSTRHVARMGRGQVHTEFCWGNPREKDHLKEPGVDGWEGSPLPPIYFTHTPEMTLLKT